ncbi:MAG: hypothetical protein Q8Q96_00850, partial [bacterium]|nr:hypothetical protein [bacterium]
RVEENGISTKVLKGDYKVEARFNQTPIEQVSNAVSIIGVLLVFIGIISSNAARVHARKKTP